METLVKSTEFLSTIQFIRPNEEYYTADDLIDAYFFGKSEGKSQYVNALKLLLASNLEKTIPVWETVNKFIVQNSFKYKKSFLKIVSVEKFEVLIVVSKEDFISDKFLKAYEFASNLEDAINCDDYNINFSFTYDSEEFNENCLITEGYNLQFKPKVN